MDENVTLLNNKIPNLYSLIWLGYQLSFGAYSLSTER